MASSGPSGRERGLRGRRVRRRGAFCAFGARGAVGHARSGWDGPAAAENGSRGAREGYRASDASVQSRASRGMYIEPTRGRSRSCIISTDHQWLVDAEERATAPAAFACARAVPGKRLVDGRGRAALFVHTSRMRQKKSSRRAAGMFTSGIVLFDCTPALARGVTCTSSHCHCLDRR